MIIDEFEQIEIPKPRNICYSGGSKGADQLFGELAKKAGHEVIHWSFQNHFSPCDKNDVRVLDAFRLSKADQYLKKANTVLKRTFPTRSEYVNNLLRRNWYQVHHAKTVYASTPFDEHMIPTGGTAWAIMMAIQNNSPTNCFIYNFDPNMQRWFYWRPFGVEGWQECQFLPPVPTGPYAGIGSSELSDVARNAIIGLYRQTGR